MKVVYQVTTSLAKIFSLGDIQRAILRDGGASCGSQAIALLRLELDPRSAQAAIDHLMRLRFLAADFESDRIGYQSVAAGINLKKDS